MSHPLLEFDNVQLGYGRRTVLDSLTFTVQRGEFLGIVGPNGSGKTTMLRAILGMLRPRAGRIHFHVQEGDGPGPRPPHRAEPAKLGKLKEGGERLRFGYVPQREYVNEMFPLTVAEIVLMGRYPLVGPLRRMGRKDREVAARCLSYVGIEDLARQAYRNLSGGQKQRALIARALAAEPHILVLDEPTNGMDLGSEHAIMELVRGLHKEGRTILMVTHVLNLVANYVERIALLNGRFQIGPAAEVLSEENLSGLYGLAVHVVEVNGQRVVISRVGEA